MPKDFLKCVKDGGKVITRRLPNGKFIRLCKTKDGKWTRGELQTRKKQKG